MIDTITIHITKKQKETLFKALKIAQCFANIDFISGFKCLSTFAFSEEKSLADSWKNIVKKFEKEYIKRQFVIPEEKSKVSQIFSDAIGFWTSKFESCKDDTITIQLAQESQETISYLADALDMIIRLSLGQFDGLYKCAIGIVDTKEKHTVSTKYGLDFSDLEVDTTRKGIFVPFQKLSIYQSYGIHSAEVSEKVRSIYEIYKELLFEWRCYGVDAFPPYKVAEDGEPLPKVEFPLQYIADADTPASEIALLIANLFNADYPIIRESKRDFSGRAYYPVISETGRELYVSLQPGEKLYRKVNGYFFVKKQ